MKQEKDPPNRYVSLPEDVYQQLIECAEANFRTIKGQTMFILRDYFTRENHKP